MRLIMSREPVLAAFFTALIENAKAKDTADPVKNLKQIQSAQPGAWLETAANKAGAIKFTTHPAKMSHPLAGSGSDVADVSTILCKREFVNDGYVHTGNASVETDVDVNATYIPILKFLFLVLSDGQRVIDHFVGNTDTAKEMLSECEDPESVRMKFIQVSMPQNGTTHSTSPLLPQVYFPVDDDYHLLTVLQPSSMLFGLKDRVSKHIFGDEVAASRNARNENKIGNDYLDVRGLTIMGFGGTKPANVSYLNSSNAGKAFLLNAEPPVLKKSDWQRLPHQDLFGELCPIPRYLLKSFHGMASASKYVTDVINWRDNVLKDILDVMIIQALKLKQMPANWSEGRDIPAYQMALLDAGSTPSNKYDHADALAAFTQSAVDWFVQSYHKQFGDEAFEFGITELAFIKKLFAEELEDLL